MVLKCTLVSHMGTVVMKKTFDITTVPRTKVELRRVLERQDLRLQQMPFTFTGALPPYGAATQFNTDAAVQEFFRKSNDAVTFDVVIEGNNVPTVQMDLVDEDMVTLHIYPLAVDSKSEVVERVFFIPVSNIGVSMARSVKLSIKEIPPTGMNLVVFVVQKNAKHVSLDDEGKLRDLLRSHARSQTPVRVAYQWVKPGESPSSPPPSARGTGAATTTTPPTTTTPKTTTAAAQRQPLASRPPFRSSSEEQAPVGNSRSSSRSATGADVFPKLSAVHQGEENRKSLSSAGGGGIPTTTANRPATRITPVPGATQLKTSDLLRGGDSAPTLYTSSSPSSSPSGAGGAAAGGRAPLLSSSVNASSSPSPTAAPPPPPISTPTPHAPKNVLSPTRPLEKDKAIISASPDTLVPPHAGSAPRERQRTSREFLSSAPPLSSAAGRRPSGTHNPIVPAALKAPTMTKSPLPQGAAAGGGTTTAFSGSNITSTKVPPTTATATSSSSSPPRTAGDRAAPPRSSTSPATSTSNVAAAAAAGGSRGSDPGPSCGPTGAFTGTAPSPTPPPTTATGASSPRFNSNNNTNTNTNQTNNHNHTSSAESASGSNCPPRRLVQVAVTLLPLSGGSGPGKEAEFRYFKGEANILSRFTQWCSKEAGQILPDDHEPVASVRIGQEQHSLANDVGLLEWMAVSREAGRSLRIQLSTVYVPPPPPPPKESPMQSAAAPFFAQKKSVCMSQQEIRELTTPLSTTVESAGQPFLAATTAAEGGEGDQDDVRASIGKDGSAAAAVGVASQQQATASQAVSGHSTPKPTATDHRPPSSSSSLTATATATVTASPPTKPSAEEEKSNHSGRAPRQPSRERPAAPMEEGGSSSQKKPTAPEQPTAPAPPVKPATTTDPNSGRRPKPKTEGSPEAKKPAVEAALAPPAPAPAAPADKAEKAEAQPTAAPAKPKAEPSSGRKPKEAPAATTEAKKAPPAAESKEPAAVDSAAKRDDTLGGSLPEKKKRESRSGRREKSQESGSLAAEAKKAEPSPPAPEAPAKKDDTLGGSSPPEKKKRESRSGRREKSTRESSPNTTLTAEKKPAEQPQPPATSPSPPDADSLAEAKNEAIQAARPRTSESAQESRRRLGKEEHVSYSSPRERDEDGPGAAVLNTLLAPSPPSSSKPSHPSNRGQLPPPHPNTKGHPVVPITSTPTPTTTTTTSDTASTPPVTTTAPKHKHKHAHSKPIGAPVPTPHIGISGEDNAEGTVPAMVCVASSKFGKLLQTYVHWDGRESLVMCRLRSGSLMADLKRAICFEFGAPPKTESSALFLGYRMWLPDTQTVKDGEVHNDAQLSIAVSKAPLSNIAWEVRNAQSLFSAGVTGVFEYEVAMLAAELIAHLGDSFRVSELQKILSPSKKYFTKECQKKFFVQLDAMPEAMIRVTVKDLEALLQRCFKGVEKTDARIVSSTCMAKLKICVSRKEALRRFFSVIYRSMRKPNGSVPLAVLEEIFENNKEPLPESLRSSVADESSLSEEELSCSLMARYEVEQRNLMNCLSMAAMESIIRMSNYFEYPMNNGGRAAVQSQYQEQLQNAIKNFTPADLEKFCREVQSDPQPLLEVTLSIVGGLLAPAGVTNFVAYMIEHCKGKVAHVLHARMRTFQRTEAPLPLLIVYHLTWTLLRPPMDPENIATISPIGAALVEWAFIAVQLECVARDNVFPVMPPYNGVPRMIEPISCAVEATLSFAEPESPVTSPVESSMSDSLKKSRG